MFQKISNQNLNASSKENFLIQSFRIIINDLQCIIKCSTLDLCSLAIIDDSICKIYIKNDLRESNLIYSTTSTIYVKTTYNQINKYLIYYWPLNGNYFELISKANLYNDLKVSFVTDRFNRLNSSIYLNYGRIYVPSGYYIYGDFTLTAWIKMYTLETFRRFFRLELSGGYSIMFSLSHNNAVNRGPYFYYYSNDVIANTSLTIGKWQHLAFAMKGSTLSIYIDGTCVSRSLTDTVGAPYVSAAYFGFASSNAPNMAIDDIKIYNISLSQNEIIQSSFSNL